MNISERNNKDMTVSRAIIRSILPSQTYWHKVTLA